MILKKITFTLLTLLFFNCVFAQFEDLPTNFLPEQAIIDEWNGSTWQEQAQLNISFNSNCQPLVTETSVASIVFSRVTNTYNAQGELTERLTESFNGIGLQNSGWSLFTTTNGSIDEEIKYIWDGASWQLSERLTFTYNGLDQLLEQVTQTWNANNSEFVNSFRTQYTRNGSGFITEENFQNWNPGGSTWVNSNRTIFTLNGSNQETESIQQIWDLQGMMWMNVERTTSTYSSGNLMEVVYENWDGTDWQINENEVYTYDTNENLESLVVGIWNGTAFDPESRSLFELDSEGRSTEVISQDFVNNDWENTNRITLTYPSCATLSSEDNDLLGLSIFPNPANEQFRLANLEDFDQKLSYAIYDMEGRLVKKGNLPESKAINTSSLNSGFYMVRFDLSGQVTSKRLIVNH